MVVSAILYYCGTLIRSVSMRKMPRLVSLAIAIVPAAWLVGCQNLQKSNVSINYYRISGNSTAALDSEIKRKGPKINGGNHAVAIARIKMDPQISYEQIPSGCKISDARVLVGAKVTLPKWIGRNRASPKLGRAWDNIDRYTRKHEAAHVEMAFSHARKIEQKLSGLGTKPNCEQLKSSARQIIARHLKEHDKAQRKFDANEQSRFAKLAKKNNFHTAQ